jgi:NodT family efflux transporter outer membrane factor (OMF) lipoprotein
MKSAKVSLPFVTTRHYFGFSCGGRRLLPLKSHVVHGLILAVVLPVTGCAVGPDFHQPSSPTVSGYTKEPLPEKTAAANKNSADVQYFKSGLDVSGQWWTLFHSQFLNALIEQALKNNPDLKAAQAALRVAQENLYAQQGAYYPSVGADFSSIRQKTPVASLATNAASGASVYSLHTPQVTVSYVPDIFGLNRRTVESLQAQSEYQHFQIEATYLTLTSNVVAAAIQEASLREQIAATEKVINIESEQLKLIQRQFDLGGVVEANVIAQETTLSQAQGNLPVLQKQLAQQRDLLTALIGRFPSEEPAGKFQLSELELPQELPVSLPAQLVEQRPDVRSAAAQLHAASAQIGVAVANRLPNLTLSADYGSTATVIDQLFSSGTGFWVVGGNLIQPIFQGGTLLHRQRAAEAAYADAAAQYRSVVITAFRNVADVLHAIQSDADALKAATKGASTAARGFDIAQRQMQLGGISYLTMLNAEQAYQQALITLAEAHANRFADTAALFQALGGGWWNRPENK